MERLDSCYNGPRWHIDRPVGGSGMKPQVGLSWATMGKIHGADAWSSSVGCTPGSRMLEPAGLAVIMAVRCDQCDGSGPVRRCVDASMR